MYRLSVLAFSLLMAPWYHASASLEIQFTESAPKDRFSITNTTTCLMTDLQVVIDLSKSRGQLIFDTTATGAGVDVFQPFEVGDGDIRQLDTTGVQDGDSQLALTVSEIAPGGFASFTIDVDDTLKNSDLGAIRVTGSEIEGGEVKVILQGGELMVGTFDGASKATVVLPDCAES